MRAAAEAVAAKRRAKQAGRAQEIAAVEQAMATLVCPICRGTDFESEESRQDSRWGWTTHVMKLLICTRCRFVLHFSEGQSIFDFD